jgi:HD superfamily phosphodiesterase
MTQVIAGIELPRTLRAIEATRLIQGRTSPLIFHHSQRAFLFAAIWARNIGVAVDIELVYLAALFHDSALVTPFADGSQRFELDGADFARSFMAEWGFTADAQDVVWTSIALHTTPAIPLRMGREVAATAHGVLTDAVGLGLEEMDAAAVEEITAAHPRDDFKRRFVETFVDGLRERPDTTYGTVYADVLEDRIPGFRRRGMEDRIIESEWPT